MKTALHTIAHRGILAMTGAIILLSGGCRRAPQWRVAEGAVWNTTYRIVYEAPEALDDSIQAVMRGVEMSLSPFNPNSLISRINRNETDSVNPDIERVFAISRSVNTWSGGRFDPTVSPIVNLWGFGYDKARREAAETDTTTFEVSANELNAALALVGIDSCFIANGRITKKRPATTFNFSAVTKGYGCDKVAEMLARNGSANHMVEIGGEIALAGHNPDCKPWKIQIDAPEESQSNGAATHQRLRTIAIEGTAGIATSGNYRNFHRTARYGKFGHTIDPRSGHPAHSDIVSATVTAPTAALADAWATACMASESTAALRQLTDADATIRAQQPGASLQAMLVVMLPDSTLRIMSTPEFGK